MISPHNVRNTQNDVGNICSKKQQCFQTFWALMGKYIKMDLKENKWRCDELAKKKKYWKTFVKAILNLLVP